MRNAFADELTQLAATDERVVLLSGDIGNRLFDRFQEQSRDRFLNCGVAEANMMGVAAGMGLSGLRPVVYTITPFTTTRCFEQIRVDVCYHDAPVVIVGTGSGLSYAALGPTHHSLEDLAILRTLPGMQVLAPCDANELRSLLRAAISSGAPTYIRIGKKGEPAVHSAPPDLRIGEALVIRPGNHLALVCSGTILPTALAAADRLAADGIDCEVTSMHTIKPLDTAYLDDAAGRFGLIATIEEHGRIGGLGGAVAEWAADTGAGTPLLRFGTPDEFLHEVGSQSFARSRFGLTPEDIAKTVAERFANPSVTCASA